MSNFLKHLLVQHLLRPYSIQHDILPHPALVCTVYTLFSFSRLSHKLYIHHTWYMESTAHVQLLPNTVKTHKPTRRTPLLSEDQVGPLSRRDDPPPQLSRSYLLCTSFLGQSCHKIWNKSGIFGYHACFHQPIMDHAASY